MYEQYTDKQIVETLKPKLAKLGWCKDVDSIYHYPETCKMIATIYRSAYIRGQLGRSFIIGEKKTKEPVNIFADNGVWACKNKYLEKVTEHWVPATRDNVKVGSKVRMIEETAHKDNPQWFPNVGTVGTVTEVGFHTHLVQWPEGTTSETDEWYCDDTRLEVLLCE